MATRYPQPDFGIYDIVKLTRGTPQEQNALWTIVDQGNTTYTLQRIGVSGRRPPDKRSTANDMRELTRLEQENNMNGFTQLDYVRFRIQEIYYLGFIINFGYYWSEGKYARVRRIALHGNMQEYTGEDCIVTVNLESLVKHRPTEEELTWLREHDWEGS